MASRPTEFDKEDSVILDVLSLLDKNSKITQRNLAEELNIALGLANLYIKRCIDKGWLKINQIPRNRYKYYITKKGFLEKARLMHEYFKVSFNLYREAREELTRIFQSIEQNGLSNVIISDESEIAEIAILASNNFNLNINAIVDKKSKNNLYSNIKIISDLKDITNFDVVILTCLSNPEKRFKELSKILDKKQLIVPSFLNISRSN